MFPSARFPPPFVLHGFPPARSSFNAVPSAPSARSRRLQRSPPRKEPEVIDAWGLMEGLEEGMPISNQAKKSPKPRAPASSTWSEAWRAQTSGSANGEPLAGPP
jgi:hypothetical protein